MKPALFNMLTSRRRAKARRRVVPEESTFGGYSDAAVPQDCEDCEMLATVYTESGGFCVEHFMGWANAEARLPDCLRCGDSGVESGCAHGPYSMVAHVADCGSRRDWPCHHG